MEKFIALSTEEVKKIEGGNPILVALALNVAATFLYNMVNDWDKNVAAYSAGFNSVVNK